jgi:hypothetical protein
MSSSKPASTPLVPDPLPNPNSIANMSSPQSPPTSASSASVKSPIEPTPFYGLRSWLSQVVVASFIAGGTAGAVSRTVVSPLERLKILLQVQNVGREEYKMSIGKALGKMWREEGWRGMMAGNGANCMRIVPYSAVQFGSYNIYKKVCRNFRSAMNFWIAGTFGVLDTRAIRGRQWQRPCRQQSGCVVIVSMREQFSTPIPRLITQRYIS